jgi:diaminopimelate epimerase
MSGAGNDFIVLDEQEAARLAQGFEAWVQKVCRRGLSIGADGVIVVAPRADGKISMRFHNPDGGAAFCGNGTRCAARFARERGWAGPTMLLVTPIGEIPAEVLEDVVRIALPPPLDLASVTLEVRGRKLTGRHVVAGVPHFVLAVRDLAAAAVQEDGRLLRRHPHFGPSGTNVDFVAWRRDGGLGIRTFERGVEAETLACGSGAVAAAFAAHRDGAETVVRVVPWSQVPLRVMFLGPPGAPTAALLEGDARFVFEGVLHAEAVEGFLPR